jgi:uncharacterized protein YdeI (YjbR/CyaY-like superfamily)
MFNLEDSPQFYAPDRKTWREWLRNNHKTSTGVWLQIYKKKSGKATVSYDEAVEEGLCFGWVDTKMKGVDEQYYIQLFTPRKPKSNWAQSNKERVRRLIEEDLMEEAGLESIRIAKENGSWDKSRG